MPGAGCLPDKHRPQNRLQPPPPAKAPPKVAKKKVIRKKPKVKKAIKKKPKIKKTKGTFGNYIYRVLQQIHPGAIFHQRQSSKVAQYNKKKTLSEKDIQTSTRLLLPGELSMHAISEAKKAITKFNTAKNK
uniref:Histone H2A/H2B/H3 domain-containing protein n=1 Tax=Panagrolaimus davidi TaxID=227884 RepID=A0A914Q5R8_9BILA